MTILEFLKSEVQDPRTQLLLGGLIVWAFPASFRALGLHYGFVKPGDRLDRACLWAMRRAALNTAEHGVQGRASLTDDAIRDFEASVTPPETVPPPADPEATPVRKPADTQPDTPRPITKERLR